MDLLIDGWLVFHEDAGVVLLVAGCMLWGGAVMLGFIRRAARTTDDGAESLSLVAGLWMLPCLLVSALILLISGFKPVQPVLQGLISLVILAALYWSWSRGRRSRPVFPAPFGWAILLGLIFLALMLVRLAFARSVRLPLYFDSPAHYGLIQQLLVIPTVPGTFQNLVLPAGVYYHLGYHLLLAGWVALTRVDISRLMLISGQMVLAAFPLTLYLPIHRCTGSALAATLAVVLAAVGWYMPAYAVNWGKYPALFCLPLLLGAISLGYLVCDAEMDPKRRGVLLGIALLTAGAAAIIHTRAVIVLAASLGAWVLSGHWHVQAPTRRAAGLVVILFIAAALTIYISRDPLLSPALDPYLRSGVWVTVPIAGLTLLSLYSWPRLSMACILILAFMLLALVIPAPLPAAGTLLDRPLVEMLLSLPLSFLGAAGSAGLLESPWLRRPLLRQGAAAIILLAVAANAHANYSFLPAPCCSFVAADDIVALDWLGKQVPASSRVAIAATQLQFAPGGDPTMEAAIDAGVWIRPLTHLETAPLPPDSDFRDPGILSILCERHLSYVYAGSSPQSFSAAWLQSEPRWYRARLQLPGASIYQVLACNL